MYFSFTFGQAQNTAIVVPESSKSKGKMATFLSVSADESNADFKLKHCGTPS